MNDRNKLTALASLVQEMENRLTEAPKRDYGTAALNQISSVEDSLRTEISRRAEMEQRINDSIDGKIKVSVDRIADAVESEMTRMYRKMDSELSSKVETLARDIQGLQNGRIAVIEMRLEGAEDMTRRCVESINRLETKFTSIVADLPTTSSNALVVEQSRLLITEAVLRLRAEIDESMQELKRSRAYAEKQLTDLRSRIEFESASLRAELHAESETRDIADKDLAEVVTQYAEVMDRRLSVKN